MIRTQNYWKKPFHLSRRNKILIKFDRVKYVFSIDVDGKTVYLIIIRMNVRQLMKNEIIAYKVLFDKYVKTLGCRS